MTHVSHRGSLFSIAALVFVLCFVLAPPASAQVAASGAILGTVTDPSGAVVADAEITVTNAATQQRRTVTSNGQGFYAIESLLAATYGVVVKKVGFQTFNVQTVKVDPGARVQVNANLAVGTAATEVIVQGEA